MKIRISQIPNVRTKQVNVPVSFLTHVEKSQDSRFNKGYLTLLDWKDIYVPPW